MNRSSLGLSARVRHRHALKHCAIPQSAHVMQSMPADFAAFGRAMADNTAAQADLHPALVNAAARELIVLAQEYGAIGWKVNGAGGDGGSITLLCGKSASARRSLLRTITQSNPLFQPIPIYLSRFGLRVWEG